MTAVYTTENRGKTGRLEEKIKRSKDCDRSVGVAMVPEVLKLLECVRTNFSRMFAVFAAAHFRSSPKVKVLPLAKNMGLLAGSPVLTFTMCYPYLDNTSDDGEIQSTSPQTGCEKAAP